MINSLSRGAALFFSLAALWSTPSFAKTIPLLIGPVIDETGTLSREQREQIASELQSMRDGVQIQIWITNSLENESIEGLSIRAVDTWKLGDKGKDNGALILLAMQDRRMRIEVGRGLEGSIPDVIAGRIVDSILMPHFRNGDFYGGLSKASRFIYELATGRSSADSLPKPQRQVAEHFPFGIVFLLLVFLLQFLFRRRRGFGYYGGIGGFGGGGWGRGGGGGWSGGGGGFSGGGSSGSW